MVVTLFRVCRSGFGPCQHASKCICNPCFGPDAGTSQDTPVCSKCFHCLQAYKDCHTEGSTCSNKASTSNIWRILWAYLDDESCRHASYGALSRPEVCQPAARSAGYSFLNNHLVGCQDCWGSFRDPSGAIMQHCDGPLASALQQKTCRGRPGTVDRLCDSERDELMTLFCCSAEHPACKLLGL